MPDEESRTCVECQGSMSPIIVMDKVHYSYAGTTQGLAYRQPDDKRSFWTGKYPTAGPVRAFMCEGCGRIALYGGEPDA